MFKTAEFVQTMWLPNKKFSILKDLAEKISSEVDEADMVCAEASATNVAAVEPAAKKRAAAATEKARSALEQVAAKRQRKRTVSLSAPVTTT